MLLYENRGGEYLLFVPKLGGSSEKLGGVSERLDDEKLGGVLLLLRLLLLLVAVEGLAGELFFGRRALLGLRLGGGGAALFLRRDVDVKLGGEGLLAPKLGGSSEKLGGVSERLDDVEKLGGVLLLLRRIGGRAGELFFG